MESNSYGILKTQRQLGASKMAKVREVGCDYGMRGVSSVK